MDATDAMPEDEPRAGRAGWLLAAAVLAGALASWAIVFAAPQLEQRLAPLAGGLVPRQLALQAAAAQIESLAPPPQLLVLASDPEDTAFARYLLYPRVLVEAPVRPRERRAAALAAAPDGTLVLVTDPVVRAELQRATPVSGGTRLVPAAEPCGDVALLRIVR